jgi:hypothetical protein
MPSRSAEALEYEPGVATEAKCAGVRVCKPQSLFVHYVNNVEEIVASCPFAFPDDASQQHDWSELFRNHDLHRTY